MRTLGLGFGFGFGLVQVLDREVGRLALDELLAVLVVDLVRARVGATGTGQGYGGRAMGAGL